MKIANITKANIKNTKKITLKINSLFGMKTIKKNPNEITKNTKPTIIIAIIHFNKKSVLV